MSAMDAEDIVQETIVQETYLLYQNTPPQPIMIGHDAVLTVEVETE